MFKILVLHLVGFILGYVTVFIARKCVELYKTF